MTKNLAVVLVLLFAVGAGQTNEQAIIKGDQGCRGRSEEVRPWQPGR